MAGNAFQHVFRLEGTHHAVNAAGNLAADRHGWQDGTNRAPRPRARRWVPAGMPSCTCSPQARASSTARNWKLHVVRAPRSRRRLLPLDGQ